jgi:hypothetical protein
LHPLWHPVDRHRRGGARPFLTLGLRVEDPNVLCQLYQAPNRRRCRTS